MEQLKILVVDDEARMRKLVKDFLVRKQYTVVEAGDGEEAIELFVKENDFIGCYDAKNGRLGSLQGNKKTFKGSNYYADCKR